MSTLALLIGSGVRQMDKPELITRLIHEGIIKSVAVEKAFMAVNREDFIPDDQKHMTYFDTALSIPAGQTISAPHMIAKILELAELKKGQKVLEVGTGSGYNAALLAEIVGQENIITIERHAKLVAFARENLKHAGYDNIKIIEGDGSNGYEEESPYDRIISTAAAPKIPYTWENQIKPGGLIVSPVGGRHFYQELAIARKSSEGKMHELHYGECIFVPLIGQNAWPDY